MQYNININQKAFSELAPNCDVTDAAIFSFIFNFIASGNCKRLKDSEEDWFWVSYQKIIDDNPILGINSKPTIYRRVENLIEADILKRHPQNKGMARTYLGRGKNYQKMVYDRPQSNMNEGSIKNDRGANTQMIEDHNTSNPNNNISYVQYVDLWNEVNDCNLRITDGKREQIRARLNTFSEDEIKESMRNRSQDSWINGEGSKYKTNWDSFWRNDEKIERYLVNDDMQESSGNMNSIYKTL